MDSLNLSELQNHCDECDDLLDIVVVARVRGFEILFGSNKHSYHILLHGLPA